MYETTRLVSGHRSLVTGFSALSAGFNCTVVGGSDPRQIIGMSEVGSVSVPTNFGFLEFTHSLEVIRLLVDSF